MPTAAACRFDVHVFDPDPRRATDLRSDGARVAAARSRCSWAGPTCGRPGDAGGLHVARRIEDDTGLSFRHAGDWIRPWEVADDPTGQRAE